MRPPWFLLSTAFFFSHVTFSQQRQVKLIQPTIKTSQLNLIEFKLSPVPPEAEGLPSPPVPDVVDTEYEVLGAPDAPNHNFILQPVSQGMRPSPSNIYSINDHYFINQQGHLVLKPQRPIYSVGANRPPLLNFNESPPAFPHLTDEELYMLGQPVPLHQNSSRPSPQNSILAPDGAIEGNLPEVQPNITNSLVPTPVESDPKPQVQPSISSSMAQNQSQPIIPVISTTVTPLKTTNQSSFNTKQPSDVPLPPQRHPESILPPPSYATQNGPVGEYIATVGYGPNNPSYVFRCIPKQYKNPGRYVHSPPGYSCRMTKARPSLANHLLMANNQKPVAQPVVSSEPVPLPIIIPVQFFETDS